VGYLSDRIGTKTVFLMALALFTVGSGLCALAPNEGFLIACRVVQGLGGGAIFPVAFAIAFRVFPPAERGPASALISVPVLLAPVFGPTIGGLLTTYFNWRAIFTVNLPIGVVVFILGMLTLRGHAQEAAEGDELPAGMQKGFDVVGLLLAVAGTVALVYGINQSAMHNFTDQDVWPFITAGGVLLLAFILYELRQSDPVMDMRLFTNYRFAMANLLTWMLSAFLFGSLFFLPVFFEQVQGRTALNTGLILGVQGIASIISVIAAGLLYNRIGPRPILLVGFVLITGATVGFINLAPNTDPSVLIPWLAVRGLGFGLTNIPLQTLAVATISNRAMARASSLLNVTRQIFSAVGLSLLTAYFTNQSTSHATDLGKAYAAANGTMLRLQCFSENIANPAAIPACITQAVRSYVQQPQVVQQFLTSALNDTFLVVMIGTGVAALLSIFAGRDPNVQKLKADARRAKNGELPLPAPEGVEERRPAFVGE
jgi:EmrB/QacA subfamily drug resistance transporter